MATDAPVQRPYHWLAQYYDLIFTPFRTPIDAARDRVLSPILPAISTGCDLACGTGTTALALARGGLQMYAADNSAAMCRVTRDKFRRAEIPVRVIRADMRDFQLPEPVDLITCEYDAINHVPEKADLIRVTRSVARNLEPGGYFYFDVNNRLAFELSWQGTFCIERPGVLVVMRNESDPRRNRAWSNVEWFIREGKLWRRHHERVDEVCWTEREIERALERAGFDSIHSWDGAQFYEDHPAVRPGCRTVYLARKRRSPTISV